MSDERAKRLVEEINRIEARNMAAQEILDDFDVLEMLLELEAAGRDERGVLN